MWNVHSQSVTHCQRRLAAKFQFTAFLDNTTQNHTARHGGLRLKNWEGD